MKIIDAVKDKLEWITHESNDQKYKRGKLTEKEWLEKEAGFFYESILDYWGYNGRIFSHIKRHTKERYKEAINIAGTQNANLKYGRETNYYALETLYDFMNWNNDNYGLRGDLYHRNKAISPAVWLTYEGLENINHTIGRNYTIKDFLPYLFNPEFTKPYKEKYALRCPPEGDLADFSYLKYEKSLQDDYHISYEDQVYLFMRYYMHYIPCIQDAPVAKRFSLTQSPEKLSCFDEIQLMRDEEDGSLIEPEYIRWYIEDWKNSLDEKYFKAITDLARSQYHQTPEEVMRDFLKEAKELKDKGQ